jgi:hypothetical protein
MCKSIKEQSRDTGNIEHKSKNDDKQTNKQTNKQTIHTQHKKSKKMNYELNIFYCSHISNGIGHKL